MDWGSLAPVALGGVLAAGGGFLGQWWSDRRTAEREELRLGHELERIRADRTQTRRGDAYVDLLDMALTVGNYCADLQRLWDTDPPQPRAPLPSREVQSRTYAKVYAYGSQAAKDSTAHWRESVDAVFEADSFITFSQALGKKGDVSSELDKQEHDKKIELLRVLRPAEVAARERLQHLVWTELGDEPPAALSDQTKHPAD